MSFRTPTAGIKGKRLSLRPSYFDYCNRITALEKTAHGVSALHSISLFVGREDSPYATVGLQVSEEFLKEREVDDGTLCVYI